MSKFLKLITADFMEGVSEPWCHDQGVVVLPYSYQYGQYWFLLINENNPLFANRPYQKLGSLTGGCEADAAALDTAIRELKEETGIDIKDNKKVIIHDLGKYYANKTNVKFWHFYGIDVTHLNLDLKATYQGAGDGSVGEQNISGYFVNETELTNTNDALTLAAYAKLVLNEIIVPNHQKIG